MREEVRGSAGRRKGKGRIEKKERKERKERGRRKEKGKNEEKELEPTLRREQNRTTKDPELRYER